MKLCESILFINFNIFICNLFKYFRRPINIGFILTIFRCLLWNWLLLTFRLIIILRIFILIILKFSFIRRWIRCLFSINFFINIIILSLLWKFFKDICIHILINIRSIEFFILSLLRILIIHLLNITDFRLFFRYFFLLLFNFNFTLFYLPFILFIAFLVQFSFFGILLHSWGFLSLLFYCCLLGFWYGFFLSLRFLLLFCNLLIIQCRLFNYFRISLFLFF